jgi:hypothetical protein
METKKVSFVFVCVSEIKISLADDDIIPINPILNFCGFQMKLFFSRETQPEKLC